MDCLTLKASCNKLQVGRHNKRQPPLSRQGASEVTVFPWKFTTLLAPSFPPWKDPGPLWPHRPVKTPVVSRNPFMDVTPTFNPLYHPLSPSIEGLLEFVEEVDHENPNHLTLEWIVNEIKNHTLSYVRIGYIAAKVKLCKLWDRAKKGARFTSFQQWCEIALGRSHWQINRLIEAAQVVINLARAGFSYLPQNEAQARPLVKLSPDEQCQKWDEVLRSLPHHRITAGAIAEIVGVKTAQSHRIELDGDTYEALAKKAAEAGLTPKELLKRLIEGYDPDPETEDFPEPDPDPTDDHEPVIPQQQLQRWEADLDALVSEYENRVQSFSNSS